MTTVTPLKPSVRYDMKPQLSEWQLATRLLYSGKPPTMLVGDTWCDSMARFTERNGKTPELVLSGSQILLTSITLLSAASIFWVLLERLLFRP